jgi:type IV fimbrial biogenesis protein FimT
MGAHRNLTGRRTGAGFTLPELLAAIAITGILAALAAPSMSQFVANQRLKSASSELFLALLRARSEAVKRNADITVQPVSTWNDGWTIPNPGDSANPIAVYSAPVKTTVTGPASVTFTAAGRVRGSGAVNFSFTASGTTKARCVALDLSGRAYQKATAC